MILESQLLIYRVGVAGVTAELQRCDSTVLRAVLVQRACNPRLTPYVLETPTVAIFVLQFASVAWLTNRTQSKHARQLTGISRETQVVLGFHF